MRNFTLFISAILLSAVCATAQNTAGNTITGRAVEAADSTQGVGFATVSLLRDSTIVTAVAADGDGRFTIRTAQRGDMSLQITMIGYQTATRAVAVAAGATDVGDIAMEEGVAIDDVVITVQKPLVTSDAEKLTYSVENDPDAASSTLEEIIRKVPQLSLDAEGNILLNGSSDYKVLLNGHNSSMFSGNNLKEIIKSMPASQIKRIEVVTNPSMKYEADGASGIINRITAKKNDMNGYNGSVHFGMRVDAHIGEFANATA
ncbi:MAG: carboxypeptidase regulatory-like domain-containing protein, partial [Alistipes sp.]|nr:carboxypeptidase regulatory-like domain-containing protein [Alistipes sp.]